MKKLSTNLRTSEEIIKLKPEEQKRNFEACEKLKVEKIEISTLSILTMTAAVRWQHQKLNLNGILFISKRTFRTITKLASLSIFQQILFVQNWRIKQNIPRKIAIYPPISVELSTSEIHTIHLLVDINVLLVTEIRNYLLSARQLQQLDKHMNQFSIQFDLVVTSSYCQCCIWKQSNHCH